MVKTISINAFGCNPDFGSERGLGWIWISALSKNYDIVCYTEEDSRESIERLGVDLYNVRFVYINISRFGHRIIYNQGNYLGYIFYVYYQWLVFVKAILRPRTDVYHHLNMIGFRIPGLFWLVAIIKRSKSIWGPIGGINLVPLRVYSEYGIRVLIKSNLKNLLNVTNIFLPNVILANLFYNRRVFVYHSVITKMMFAQRFYPETFMRDVSHQQQLKSIDFVIVGKFDYRKNHLLAIDALAHAGFTNKKVYFIGDGSYKRVIENHAKRANLNITFTGNIPREEVIKILADTKVLINASVDEGTSHAVIEALSQNCQIAGFKVGGHSNYQSTYLSDVDFFDSYNTLVSNLSKSIKNAFNSTTVSESKEFSALKFANSFYP